MIELDLFTCAGHKTFQNSKKSARFCEKILLNSIKFLLPRIILYGAPKKYLHDIYIYIYTYIHLRLQMFQTFSTKQPQNLRERTPTTKRS